MSTHDDNDDTLPAAIIERLAARERQVSMLTPQADREIAQAARAQFAARRAHRRPGIAPIWGLSAAAAAALVFVIVAVRPPLSEPGSAPGSVPAALQRTAAADDYDRSGTVDVLDAWWLSRELARNPRFAAAQSVDGLMRRIVRLDGGVQ